MTERNAYSETENKVDDVAIEQKSPLIYKISDSPPIYLTIFFAFQVSTCILLYNCSELCFSFEGVTFPLVACLKIAIFNDI